MNPYYSTTFSPFWKMLRPLICGSGSFDSELGRNKEKKSSKSCKGRPNSGKSNPFSTRGLDKFSSLVADLREKRQRIYTQSDDADEFVYVWFEFSSGSEACKPVILKQGSNKPLKRKKALFCDHKALETVENKNDEISEKGRKKAERRRSLGCLVGAVILTLMLLLVFGRSATVMWITVGWYLVPTTNNATSVTRRMKIQSRVPSQIQAMLLNRGAK